MDRSAIVTQVRLAICDVLSRDAAELDEQARLFEDLALDSTMVIELLMALEDTTDLKIDPDELEPEVFRTVGSLADYVENSLSRTRS